MNDGKLILKIGADITEFQYKIEDIDARLKELYETAKTTLGKNLPEVNLEIKGLERTKQELERFGSFAEGTLGSLINQKKRLEEEQLSIPLNTAAFEEAGRKIGQLDTQIKNFKKTGREPIKEIISPAAIGSIDYFNEKVKELTSQRRKISFDTEEGRQQIAQLTQQIEFFESKSKGVANFGKKVEFIEPESILGLQNKLSELENKRIRIKVTDTEELAALNNEIAETRERIVQANSITLDPKGRIQNAAAKARQSIVNLGLVVQDLPFGFIAIQNNIPNLVQSFVTLSQEAKTAGVTVGSQLAAQFKGTAGAIFGIGLAVSALTAGFTYLIQKYGSVSAALDSFFGKVNPLEKVITRANKALKEFSDNFKTVGETLGEANASAEKNIIRLESLAETVIDVTKTERARKSALDELKRTDNDRFGRYDIEKNKLEGLIESVKEYTNVIIAKQTAEKLADRASEALATREILRNQYAEQIKQLDDVKKRYPGVAEAAADYNRKLKEYIAIQQSGALKTTTLLPTPAEGVTEFEQVNTELQKTEGNLKKVNGEYDKYRGLAKKATLENLAFGESLTTFDGKTVKVKFEFELPKLEEFKDITDFYDPKNAISRLEKYADVLLDVTQSEKDRTSVLNKLAQEAPKVTKGNFTLFDSLKLGVSPLEKIKEAVINYGFVLQELYIINEDLKDKSKIKFEFEPPKLERFLKEVEGFYEFEAALKRIDDYGKILLDPSASVEKRIEVLKKLQKEQKNVFSQDAAYFDNLEVGVSTTEQITNAFLAFNSALQQALVDKKRISTIFDSEEIKNQFEIIQELAKGLPKNILPSFKEFETEITKIFSEFIKSGKELDETALKAAIESKLLSLKTTVEKAQLGKALASVFGGDDAAVKITDQIDAITSGIKNFQQEIQQNLEKPFRDFFDTLLDEGKVSLQSFFDLFKDILKRIAAQIISSGIAKLVTNILFPETAVAGAIGNVIGGKGGPKGLIGLITKIFGGATKNAIGGVQFGQVGGGVQLQGQVTFVQRGSDLVGVLNRTNGTINRVG